MSKVSRNIVYNLFGQALIVALGFWGTRLVFRRLGDEALGVLFFAISLNAVLTPLIDLGVSSTVIRDVARHFRTDREYVVRLARTTALFYWSCYAICGIALWLVAPWLVSRWIHLQTLSPRVASQSLRYLGLALLLMLPRSLFSNLLRGIERMEFNNMIDVATIALQQGGTIVVIMAGGGLVEISYFYLASFILSVAAYILVAARFVPWKAFLPGYSHAIVSENFPYTSRVGAYSVLAVIQMEADKVLVSRWLPITLLGFYGVAQSMVARVIRIPGAVTQAAFPRLSALFHAGDREGLVYEYRRLQDLVCFGLIPVFAAIIFASRPLFTYMLNADAARILLLPTALLCLGWYMNATLNIPGILSLAVDRPDIGMRQNLYALFLILPITAGLIWKWQLVGAGLSLVVYELYAYTYGARRIAAECLGMAPRLWYLHVLRIIVLAALTYGAAWGLLALDGGYSILRLVVAYAIASVAYLYATYFCVGGELRKGVLGWSRRASARAIHSVTSTLRWNA